MRLEIRRRALRAAAAVSLVVGVTGCGTVTVLEDEAPEEGAEGDEEAVADAGTPPEDAATPEDASVADGSTPDASPTCDAESPDYWACCEQHDWNLDAGCMAWGPPVPPAMRVS
ncbi:hypothetical protein [Chondromyces crocatus]|uniref:Lipoprotein n=1 Tax=Chondromyces crocatus TaxID=52 RepID=A0A0K1ESQ3_CHOCO|nr:hypothetical protein [Chondromyces crocatus]AKT43896.1 uncharacterized protein CMC5_081330 [Chondromyces crocatus]